MPTPGPGRIGVYVLGMHRSGTSALTRAINLLGIPIAAEQLLEPSPENPAGYWEPRELVGFNDRLLSLLGGWWGQPPPIEVSVHAGALLAEQIPVARELFRRVHPTEQWLWKDPRNCLLLRFWRAVLDEPAVAVLCYRDPVESMASMRRRHFEEGPPVATRDLWELYVRSALELSRDMSVLVVDYAALLAGRVAQVERLGRFLAGHGLVLDAAEGERLAIESLQTRLRRERAGGDWRALTPAQRELADALRRAAGADGPVDGL